MRLFYFKVTNVSKNLPHFPIFPLEFASFSFELPKTILDPPFCCELVPTNFLKKRIYDSPKRSSNPKANFRPLKISFTPISGVMYNHTVHNIVINIFLRSIHGGI